MTEPNIEGLAAKMNSPVTDTTCPACGEGLGQSTNTRSTKPHGMARP
jgi:hypothetical protein